MAQLVRATFFACWWWRKRRTTVERQADAFASPRSSSDWGGRVTRAEVDLDAIAANVAALATHAKPAQLLVVVKADGYGHGAVAVGRTALKHGADRLGVYCVDEAVALRDAEIGCPILVLGPFASGEVNEIWRHDLTPTITSIEAGRRLAATARGRKLSFHVKVDTGLTRAGVMPDSIVELMTRLSAEPALLPEGIFTHFAAADEADKSSAERQFRIFSTTVESLERMGHFFPIRHVSNSAAVHDLPHMRLDMVRCGISVYGYYPSPHVRQEISLRPALTLVSAITRIQRIRKDTGVGYGHEFRAPRDTAVGLVPIGYGDGLPRSFGKGQGKVLIRGHWAPVVGRVSMDQITVDVTDIDDVAVGDEVVVIGRQRGREQGADDIGAQTGTISYDILTGILPRVPRLYVENGAVTSRLRMRYGIEPLCAGRPSNGEGEEGRLV